eukprot:m.596970 g.596970  ORF g.596970 m.596970 type:complete len:90 (-) comp58060_c0_seq2:96-365(-)
MEVESRVSDLLVSFVVNPCLVSCRCGLPPVYSEQYSSPIRFFHQAGWKSSKQPQFLVSAVATDVDTPQEECRIVIELVNAEDNVHSKEL